MKKYFLIWIAILSITFILPAKADFKPGDTVFVSFPASNIKDDAFIVGLVKKRLENGDYQIRVLDYMQGHDYSLSCVPIKEDEFGQATEVVWEAWEDRTKLYRKGMQYQVSQENVTSHQSGKFNFIERNNLLISYLRWHSNAPVFPIHLFHSMIERSEESGLSGFVPSLKLAKQERKSYYDSQNNRPFWPYETIYPLNNVLERIVILLETDSNLNALWRSSPRNWAEIKKTSKTYFLIKTIDKIVRDAGYQLTESGMEKVDPVILEEFKKRLTFLKGDK